MHNAYHELVAMVADGTLSARVDRTVGLEDWKEALRPGQDETGREGKVVFVFGERTS